MTSYVTQDQLKAVVSDLTARIEAEARERRAEDAGLRASIDSGLGGMRQEIGNIRSDINAAFGEMRGNMGDQQRTTQLLTIALAEQNERIKAIQEQIVGERGLSLMNAFKEMRTEIARRFDRQDEDTRGLQSMFHEMRSDLARLETRYNQDVRERAQEAKRRRVMRERLMSAAKALLSNRTALVIGGAILGMLASVGPAVVQAIETLFR